MISPVSSAERRTSLRRASVPPNAVELCFGYIEQTSRSLQRFGLAALPIGHLRDQFGIGLPDCDKAAEEYEQVVFRPERIDPVKLGPATARACIATGAHMAMRPGGTRHDAGPFLYPIHAWSLQHATYKTVVNATLAAVHTLPLAHRDYQLELLRLMGQLRSRPSDVCGKGLGTLLLNLRPLHVSDYSAVHAEACNIISQLAEKDRVYPIAAALGKLVAIKGDAAVIASFDQLLELYRAIDPQVRSQTITEHHLGRDKRVEPLSMLAQNIKQLPDVTTRRERWDQVLRLSQVNFPHSSEKTAKAWLAATAPTLPYSAFEERFAVIGNSLGISGLDKDDKIDFEDAFEQLARGFCSMPSLEDALKVTRKLDMSARLKIFDCLAPQIMRRKHNEIHPNELAETLGVVLDSVHNEADERYVRHFKSVMAERPQYSESTASSQDESLHELQKIQEDEMESETAERFKMIVAINDHNRMLGVPSEI